jgi:S1-C subfamily serine protease
MNIVDIIIVLLLITALLRGVDLGFVRQLFSTAGLLLGFFVGAIVQGKLIHLANTPAHKALLSVLTILAAVMLFSSVGEYIGIRIKARIQEIRLRGVNKADKLFGSALAGVTLLVVVWLAAAIFSNAPFQALQRQISNSVIIAQLDKTLPSAPQAIAQLGHLIDPNGFPDVFTGLEPRIDTNTPLPSIGELDASVQQARASVVKVQGEGCGGVSTGSGFIAEEGLVVTNAHVIAGVARPMVVDANGRHETRVVWFDPNLDVAVLQAGGLAGEPLVIRTDIARNGTPAAVLGYPGGGSFVADPATILESFQAVGRNIYNQGDTERQVYSVKSDINPGNSGGPLIDSNANVIGLIFAESTTYDQVGYALTMAQVASAIEQANASARTVGTGSCAR